LAIRARIKQKVRRLTRSCGFEVNRVWQNESQEQGFPLDFEEEDIEIISKVQPYTQTSPERIYGLTKAVSYIIENEVQGGVVECGVWKGGSMMAVALCLLKLGIRNRDLFLFDTFEGMPAPQEVDVSVVGEHASWLYRQKLEIGEAWNQAGISEVRQAIAETGYDMKHVHLIKGRVEETLPKCAPSSISLLRLDTDLYQSTRHELIHLFPLLTSRGVLIIDDYGYFKGARLAVDEYIRENEMQIFLSRMDESGRIAIKL
jgi:O-methyltransferase